MKPRVNTLTTAVLMLIVISTVNGQTEEKKPTHIFGIVAGGTLANISNHDGAQRLGFQGGLYWEWKFSEKFSTMPNLLYAERGAAGKNGLSSIKLSYLTLPVVLKYNISEKFAVAAGIAWDGLVAVNADGYTRDDFREDDWRIPIAFGYGLTRNLMIGIGYNFGLTDITKNDDAILHNNWGSISLAYLFM